MNEISRQYRCEYPAISISDCITSKIIVDENTVTFRFDDIGVWVKNNEFDSFHRTKKAILSLYKCDIENIDLFILKEKRIFGKACRIREYLEFDEFVSGINAEEFHFEIVQEYKSNMGSLFVGRVRNKKAKADCYLQIEYKRYGVLYEEY